MSAASPTSYGGVLESTCCMSLIFEGKWSRDLAISADMQTSDRQIATTHPEVLHTNRTATVSRKTGETDVTVTIDLDGSGICEVNTGIPFLDHMLHQIASHGLFDLKISAVGDIEIDDHHTNEDVGITLGMALNQALGQKRGIVRFGHFVAPLDESLVQVALDFSGRPHLSYGLNIPTQRVGTYDTQLVREFFVAVVNHSQMTLHIRQLDGINSHHIIEATFKAFARAMRMATEADPRRTASAIPSSKGVL
jgi:imidazoleglycerol-phosphate dehydratase